MKVRVTLVSSAAYGGTPELWVIRDEFAQTAGVYFDEAGTQSVTGPITMPRAECLSVTGFYLGDVQYIDAGGEIVDLFAFADLTEDTSLVPRASRVSWRIALDHNGGTSEASAIYYRINGGGLYADDQCTDGPITATELPMRPMWKTTGYFLNGVKYINGIDATFTDALLNATITQNYTLTAEWERTFYRLTLDPTGGEGGLAAFYYRISDGLYYSDLGNTPIGRVIDVPTRAGYAFGGFYYGSFCGVDAGGIVNVDFYGMTLTADYTLTAEWTANTYTVTFDYAGGAAGVQSKTVTFAQPIGELPTSTKTGFRFAGWSYNGSPVSAKTVYAVPSDVQLVAVWAPRWNSIVDYFGLGSATLVPFESDAGENRQHIVTRHYGKFKREGAGSTPGVEGASADSGAWRNPTVKYMVVGDMTLVVRLGKAFPASTNTTGYMMTSVAIETGERRFPVVTVQGTANEGADAINLFDVRVPLLARARAQNLLDAIATSGGTTTGGELKACSLMATCDPVVLTENMMPCASDVVGGRYELHAETHAMNDESEPTMASARTWDGVRYGGFTLAAAPIVGEGTNYRRYRVTARKEIV